MAEQKTGKEQGGKENYDGNNGYFILDRKNEDDPKMETTPKM